MCRNARFKMQVFRGILYLVDVSDIFYFFCSGRGKGESEAGGDSIFIENPRRGGGFLEEGEVPRGCLR